MKRKIAQQEFVKPDQILQNRIDSNKIYQQGHSSKHQKFRSNVREKFEGIDLSGQDLTGAQLCRDIGDMRYPAVFENCNLENTIFVDACVTDVKWIDCLIAGADFTGTGVRPEQFKNCPGSEGIFAKPRSRAKHKKNVVVFPVPEPSAA
jgi:hypothetical protein